MQRAQSSFLNDWVTFEVLRQNLDFDLGTMELTPDGFWVDPGEINREIAWKTAARWGIECDPLAGWFEPENPMEDDIYQDEEESLMDSEESNDGGGPQGGGDMQNEGNSIIEPAILSYQEMMGPLDGFARDQQIGGNPALQNNPLMRPASTRPANNRMLSPRGPERRPGGTRGPEVPERSSPTAEGLEFGAAAGTRTPTTGESPRLDPQAFGLPVLDPQDQPRPGLGLARRELAQSSPSSESSTELAESSQTGSGLPGASRLLASALLPEPGDRKKSSDTAGRPATSSEKTASETGRAGSYMPLRR